MAQILTPHVWDDCEAIVELFGVPVWDVHTLGNNPFSTLVEPRTREEMLASGLSEDFLDNFINRVANLWITTSKGSVGVSGIARAESISHQTTYAVDRFSSSVSFRTTSHIYTIKKEQPYGSDEYLYTFTKTATV